MDAPVPNKENENNTDVAKTEEITTSETKIEETTAACEANDNKLDEPVAVTQEVTAQEEPATKVEALKTEPASTITPEEKSTILNTLKFKPAPEPRWRRTLEEHGYKVAGLFVAIGAGWIIGAHSFAPAPQTREIVDALNAVTTRLEHVEQFTTRLNAQTQEISGLKAALASMRTVMDANRAEAQVANAQLAARIANQPQPDLSQITQRLDQLESAGQTSRIQRSEAPRIEPIRARLPSDGFVLLRVTNGVAAVDTSNGIRQVTVGDYLPGAGRVRSIERRGREWVVLTSAGVIDQQGY